LKVTAKVVTVEVVENLECFSAWQNVPRHLQRLINTSGGERSAEILYSTLTQVRLKGNIGAKL